MKYPQTFDEYLALFRDPRVYASEIGYPKGTRKEITVAVAGYKYDVYTFEGRIMGAIPRAKNAYRAATIRMGVEAKYATQYSVFAYKLYDSASVLIVAMETAKDDVSMLLKAIGGATDRCACCGADLTDPLSVARGIGPECYKKIWVSRDDVKEVMKRRVKVAA